MIFSTWRLKNRKLFLNFSSPSIRTKSEVSSCKKCWILSFLSLNTWIEKRDKKDYKEWQVWVWQIGLQTATWIASTTRWFTKCARDYKWRQDYKKRRYKASSIYTLSHCKVYLFKIYCMKKVFLMIYNFSVNI